MGFLELCEDENYLYIARNMSLFLDTQNLLSKYSYGLTGTYFVYYSDILNSRLSAEDKCSRFMQINIKKIQTHMQPVQLYYVFFWVVPRRLNYICRRFGTLYLFHPHRPMKMASELYMPTFRNTLSVPSS